MTRFITIHGHFYQPPRENPDLDKIEYQDSAAPYHDWNERINDECYRPNTCSRVLDELGRIVDIVNNYEYLSFNIGPTLMNWLLENDRETYERIIEADKISAKSNNGHGNAIAQVYNHLIMPLADYKDKVTQVQWGIADFKRHFGRDPEGMWLAETAINMETVNVLIDHGIRYTILSPFQAERVRPIFSNVWQDVSDGSIDPTQPYRIYANEDKTRYLDVFFYDAPISTAVSFEHILRNADAFANRLDDATQLSSGRPALINIATDGESYGHHEPFGDMCLAFFFKHLARKKHFRIINYAYFLELHPPISEVVIKTGDHDEGTAWSCAHGVGRWKEDCGCTTGGQEGWNQQWRKPLREGLNVLRDKLWAIYEKQVSPYFHDPLEARHDYYQVFSKQGSIEKFFEKHLKKSTKSKRSMLLQLLESQRYSQLMFTSCGWFFADISGIETVQIIRYANMAIRYVRHNTSENLEPEFLSYLAQAKSNLGRDFDGDTVYKKWIKPYELNIYKAVNQYMIGSYLSGRFKANKVYMHQINIKDMVTVERGRKTLVFARLATDHTRTLNNRELDVVLSIIGDKMRVRISKDKISNFKQLIREYQQLDSSQKQESLLRKHFTVNQSLKDLNFEESSQIMEILWRKKSKQLHHSLDKIYMTHQELINSTMLMGGYLPPEIKPILEVVMSARYSADVKKIMDQGESMVKDIQDLNHIIKTLRLDINRRPAAQYLSMQLFDHTRSVIEHPTKSAIKETVKLIRILDQIKLDIRKSEAENLIFQFYKDILHQKEMEASLKKEIKELASMMNLHIEEASH